MTAPSTSRQAYNEHVRSGKATTQRERILDELQRSPRPLNRREISVFTMIPINAVCGRVNALISSSMIRVAHVAIDRVTNQRVEYLEVVSPGPTQVRLF